MYTFLTCRDLLAFVLVSFSWQMAAQVTSDKHSVSLSQELTDYNVQLLEGKIFVFDSATSHFTRLGYERKLSSSWTMGVGISNGFISNYVIGEKVHPKLFTGSMDIALMLCTDNGKIFKSNAQLSPFFSFGYRADYLPVLEGGNSRLVSHNQYAAGVHWKIASTTKFQIQVAIDQKLQSNFNTHLRYRFGLVQKITRQRTFLSKKDPIKDEENATEKVKKLLNSPLYGTIAEDTISVETLNIKKPIPYDNSDSSKFKNQESLPLNKGTTSIDPDRTSSDSATKAPKVQKEYYVVLFSFANKVSAHEQRQELLKKYSRVELLPQSSGFIRVGLGAGVNKARALKILEEVKKKYKSAWLSLE